MSATCSWRTGRDVFRSQCWSGAGDSHLSKGSKDLLGGELKPEADNDGERGLDAVNP